MPLLEQVTIDGHQYALRHVGPQSIVWPAPPVAVATYPVLGQANMVARPIPMSGVPGDADFVSGTWTSRLDDAGDMALTFPSGLQQPSDGGQWQARFDPGVNGLWNEWIEIYRDHELESVCAVKKTPLARGQVQVQGYDAFFATKNAYERDWIVTQAPRDVIERGTQLWAPTVTDDFPAPTLSAQWNTVQAAGGTVAMAGSAAGGSSGVVLSVPASSTTNGNQSFGARAGADVANVGTIAWTNPGNITSFDGKVAAAIGIVRPTDVSHTLQASNFGFNIPSAATVVGIQVSLVRSCFYGLVQDNTVQLMVGGVQVGSNKATGSAWPTTVTSAAYGSSSDLWGTSAPTPAQVNAAGFGVAVSAKGNVTGGAADIPGPDNARVDFVSIAVYYTIAGASPFAAIQTVSNTVASTSTWRSQCTVQYSNLNGFDNGGLAITESNGDVYSINFFGSQSSAVLEVNGGGVASLVVPSAPSYGLMLESDGTWVWAFVNGQLLGCYRRQHAASSTVQTQIFLNGVGGGHSAQIVATGVLTDALQPFLMAGSDKGDYVLPGTAATYPNGGLHARYFNDLDLQSDTGRLQKILAPSRTQAYGVSAAAEYANQQDATIGAQANPTPGAATSNWSVVWYGAVYLRLSQGNYTFTLTKPGLGTAGYAVRMWVGKTQFGQQIVDDWTFSSGTGQYTVTVSAATLAGNLSYGGGTVQRDGWYPIKVEYALDAPTNKTAPALNFTPPVSYTDPGGTALTGSSSVLIPATSLSPLGCVDQRYQGISHFDLVQQTAQGFGYQFTVEPKQLESGLFPGVLAPRVREGHDTDQVLEPVDNPRADGILNYTNTLDSTDSVASLQGNGAGLQNGNAGQLQAMVYDASTLNASLFDVQGWQDFSDASFPSLLAGLLNSQLGLRLTPWQTVSADPSGRNRIVGTWPLGSTLAAMRWRPGDGLRLLARDVNLQDTEPRQILQFTRNITPLGDTGASAAFANGPASNTYPQYSNSRARTPAKTLKQQLYQATRWQRNYQHQLVTLTGPLASSTIAAGSTDASSSILTLLPGDFIVSVVVRIPIIVGTSPSIGLAINGSNVTTSLFASSWSTPPLNIPVGAVAKVSNDNRLYAQVVNLSGANSVTVQYQLIVDVLR